jgi:hypothetical protein
MPDESESQEENKEQPPPVKKKPRKRRSKKRTSKKSTKAISNGKRSRGGPGKPFPGATFESVLPLAQTIFDHAGASREMKRVTVFSALGKASESGPSRMLVVNSSRYGLTIGGVQAEFLKLTDNAISILDPATPPAESMRAKFALAIEGITPFNSLYEKFKGGKLPAPEVMKDALQDVNPDERQECVDIFIGNIKYVGLLKLTSGAEWILSIEQALEELGSTRDTSSIPRLDRQPDVSADAQAADFDSICFFIAPIGEEGEDKRKHSDMVLETLVDHAIRPFKLRVVRADKITQPGMISKQLIEHILKSRLVIADMSFHNPNVFYELAIRHLLGKPIVHLIRKRDKIPFDVGNFRTIEIDDTDMYDLIAKIETYRADIANYVREAIEGSSSADNPILSFFPGLKVTLSNEKKQ